MYENGNTCEISLLDMFSAIIKKWKALVAIALIALIIGGAAGVVSTAISNRNYGARSEFFISSNENNSYIVSLLKSDRYAEWLLMDENNLPAEYKGTEIYEEAKAIQERIALLKDELIDEAEDALFPYEYKLSQLSKKLSDAQTAYNEALTLLEMYKQADGEALKEADAAAIKNHFDVLKKYEEDFAIKSAAKDEAKKAYNDMLAEQQQMKNKLDVLNEELSNLKRDRKKIFDDIHEMYLSNPENAEKVANIKKYIVCEYADKDSKTPEKLASNAVVYITVSVPADEEYASELVEKVAAKTEDFVKTSLTSSPSCEYLNSFVTSGRMQNKSLISTTVLYGAVAAIAAVGIYCVVIVVMLVVKAQKKQDEIDVLPENTEN